MRRLATEFVEVRGRGRFNKDGNWMSVKVERISGTRTRRESFDAVERHPDKVSGAWVFRETRVPVSALFENLKDGASVAQFLEWFPGVGEWKVKAVLDYEVKELKDLART